MANWYQEIDTVMSVAQNIAKLLIPASNTADTFMALL
jgi:hypothetical protein